MLRFQRLRSLCRMMSTGGFVLVGFGVYYSWMAVHLVERDPVTSSIFGPLSFAFGSSGVFIGFGGTALRLIVRHLEDLETRLARFVEDDADPKATAQALVSFLRDEEPSETRSFPEVMTAIGQFFRGAVKG